jgi:hypothetical protein
MSKNEDLQKVTLNLFRGDYETLQALFPDNGAGPIIRQLVRDFIARTEAIERSAPDVQVTL